VRGVSIGRGTETCCVSAGVTRRDTAGRLARAHWLAVLHPAAASEADLLRTIFLRGVLAPVLSALQLLMRVGAAETGGLAAPAVAPAGAAEALDPAATEDVSGLGGEFL
jgi:hypothetical protein